MIDARQLLPLTLLLLAALPACIGPPEVPVTPLVISIDVASDVNPDASGRPSPLVLRVYQLADSEAFGASSFFDLYDDDRSILGGALLDRREITVEPGATSSLKLEKLASAREIAVV